MAQHGAVAESPAAITFGDDPHRPLAVRRVTMDNSESTHEHGRKRLRVGIAVGVGCASALCFFLLAYYVTTSGLRRALPWGASDIHELGIDRFPDFTLYLKARIREDQFLPYVSRLGLTPHYPGRRYPDSPLWGIDWQGEPEVDSWWDPSKNTEATYAENKGHVWTFAKYEDGFVYVKSFSH
jgi:hypothetical protein